MAGVKRQVPPSFRWDSQHWPCFSPKALQASIKMKRELWLASNAQLLPLYSWERNQERGGAALRRIEACIRAWCRFQDRKQKPVVAVWVAAAASDELTSAHLARGFALDHSLRESRLSPSLLHEVPQLLTHHVHSKTREGCAPLVHGVQAVFFSHTALSPLTTLHDLFSDAVVQFSLIFAMLRAPSSFAELSSSC